MVDAADAAGDEQAFVEELLLRRQQQAAAAHKAALDGGTGVCLNCEEPLQAGRFCDADCRLDYERRVQAHLRR